MSKKIVVLGLGSNLNPLENLRRALLEIRNLKNVKILKCSSLYESDALLKEGAPSDWNQPFLNSCVLCETENITALELLTQLKNIEKKMGRKSVERWSPREIDLDILVIEQEQVNLPELRVPHPELFKRPFALCPALEVYPEISKIEQMPNWVYSQSKPFGTMKSKRYFWPRFVGILNVTPDSFSDGGLYLDSQNLIQQADHLMSDGAEVLDIGAESTRPMATPVDAETEFLRLNNSLTELYQIEKVKKGEVRLSIDCRHPIVVERILDLFPVDYLNDVSGFQNPQMIHLLNRFPQIKAIAMHSLTVPADPKIVISNEDDPLAILEDWWEQSCRLWNEQEIDLSRVIFDPGIGFGKIAKQSQFILEKLNELSKISTEFFLGYSRKSFLKLESDYEQQNKDMLTARWTKKINMAYCQYLRVHEVSVHKKVLNNEL